MSVHCFRTITPTRCAWSGEIIKRGEMAYKYDDQKVFNKKIRELISPKLAEKGLPIGVRCLISEFYSVNNGSQAGVFSEESANFDVKLSRRGRVIRKPIRLENETFVTGSGVGGCDQYDRSYDNGDLNQYRRDWVDNSSENLNNFVVSDDDVIEISESSETSDSEIEFDDEYTDSDEEDEYDDWD